MYRLTNIFSYTIVVILLIPIIFLMIIQNLFGLQRSFDPALKFLAKLCPLFFGIRIDASALKIPPSDKTRIFVCNHVNIFDGFILYAYLPDFVRGVELEEHFRWPIWGQLIRLLGNIPISHKNPKSAEGSLDKAVEALKSGISLIILPEGHRTRDGKLHIFGKGAMRVAKESECHMVPLVMKGSFECKRVTSPFVKPGVVKLISGEVLSSDYIKEKTVTEIRDELYETLSGLLKE